MKRTTEPRPCPIKTILIGVLFSSSVFGRIDLVKTEHSELVPVINSVPVMKKQVVNDPPTQVCQRKQIPVRQDNGIRWIGTSIGALVGHVVSSVFNQSDVTRLLSTFSGGIVGNVMEQSFEPTNEVNDCSLQQNFHYEKVVTGYNVFYEVDGVKHSVFMDNEPEETIRIKQWVEHSVVK